MALNKTALKLDVKDLLTDMFERENTSIDEFATRLSDAIDDYVKEADIIYTTGLTSATGGAVTGTFEGNLE